MIPAKTIPDSPHKSEAATAVDDLGIDWDGADFVEPYKRPATNDSAPRKGSDGDVVVPELAAKPEPDFASDDVFAQCMTTINRQASDRGEFDDQ